MISIYFGFRGAKLFINMFCANIYYIISGGCKERKINGARGYLMYFYSIVA